MLQLFLITDRLTGKGQKCFFYLTPEPNVTGTLDFAREVVFHKIFYNSWFWVDRIIIVTSRPWFPKIHHF